MNGISIKKGYVMLFRQYYTAIISVYVICFANSVYADQSLNLELFNADDYESPGTYRMIDNDTGEYINAGSLVQLIWAGPNGIIDPVNTVTFLPGGDDEILKYDYKTMDAVAHIGDGYVEDGEGRLIASFPFIDPSDYVTGQNPSDVKVYVRFFNVSDPFVSKNQGYSAGPIKWGESEILILPQPDIFGFGFLNFAPEGPLYTAHYLYEPPSFLPVANAGGPYIGFEGVALTLDASATVDQDEDNQTLVYEWDLDCDGQYDDAYGINPVYTWNDDSDLLIGLKVTDSDNNVSFAVAALTIHNVAPELGSLSNKIVCEGELTGISTIYSDSGSADSHFVTVNWGNGEITDNLAVSGGVIELSYKYLYSGSYQVKIYLYDDDGAVVSESFLIFVEKTPINAEIKFESDGGVKLSWDSIIGRKYKIFYCDPFGSECNWRLIDIIYGANYVDCGDTDGYDNISGNDDDRVHPSYVLRRFYKIE